MSEPDPKLEEMYAHIIDKVVAMQPLHPEYCKKCKTQLSPNNRAHWLPGDNLCRECASVLGGVRMDDALFLLLSRGYMVTCLYRTEGDVWRMRVEMRSSSHVDCIRLKSTYGGSVNKHSSIWKWTISSVKDLGRIGKIIGVYIPELGIALQRYCAQPGSKARSAFAEAIATKLGRSTKLSDFVVFGE